MGKFREHIVKHQAEGSTLERWYIRRERALKIKELLSKYTPERRREYVRELVLQALNGELEIDVFRQVVKTLNLWAEVELVTPRMRLLREGLNAKKV